MFNDDSFKNFDKQFETTRKIGIVAMIAGIVFSLSVLVFGGWVAVKLLAHFGVI